MIYIARGEFAWGRGATIEAAKRECRRAGAAAVQVDRVEGDDCASVAPVDGAIVAKAGVVVTTVWRRGVRHNDR